MEKSIETIWKEGFLKSDALVAPKLNNLYNQKSKNTIDKLLRRGKMNLILIMIGASVILIGAIFAGATYMGIILFALLSALVYFGKKQEAKMKEIDKTLSSYQYIKAVDSWLQKTIIDYIKIYRFFYPAFILTFALGIWFSDPGKHMLSELLHISPNLNVILGVPVIWTVGVILIAGLFSVFAGTIYKSDLKKGYGRVFNKLDEIIADIEELRA